MTIPPHPGFNLPYDAHFNEAAWKASKTNGLRDKWHTDLSAALRAAETAYDLIHFETLDLKLYQAQHGKDQTLTELAQLKADAQHHVTTVVKPAIKALEKAKSTADTAALNPIISTASNGKAKAISRDMKQRVTMLKGITFKDYDDSLTLRKKLFDGNYAAFEDHLSTVLAAAKTFIKTVRANPTPATFNHGLPDVARDITQQLSYVTLLQRNGYRVVQSNPDHVSAGLVHWATQGGELDDDATQQEVLAEVDRFEQAVMAVYHWRM